MMRIGIDFDNTIICYDNVFNKIGVEKGLISEQISQGKVSVREYLKKKDQEDNWTWLQGYVYGNKLGDAERYKGVKPFLEFCSQSNIKCFIISHKTKYPYSGDKYDLHKAASDWIQEQNLKIDTFFELTKGDKINRINAQHCSHFIDDLPEFLSLPGFDENIIKILFDPLQKYNKSDYEYEYVNSWDEILELIKRK